MISLKRRILAIFNTLEMCVYVYLWIHTHIYIDTDTHTHIPMYEWAQWCLSELNHVQLFVTLWIGTLPGSTGHGILQARILEWVAISSSRGSSWPRDWTGISCISCIGRSILYHWATREATCIHIYIYSCMFVCLYILRNNSHSH